MITVDEFKQSKCSTTEWWHRHNLHHGVELTEINQQTSLTYYTIESAVALLNILNPAKTIAEWERS